MKKITILRLLNVFLCIASIVGICLFFQKETAFSCCGCIGLLMMTFSIFIGPYNMNASDSIANDIMLPLTLIGFATTVAVIVSIFVGVNITNKPFFITGAVLTPLIIGCFPLRRKILSEKGLLQQYEKEQVESWERYCGETPVEPY